MKKTILIGICICILFISCASHDAVLIEEVFVNGGTMTIGDGTHFSRYDYTTQDLYAAKYEFSWGILVQTIHYGIDNGYLEIKDNKLYPLSGSFPEFSKVILDFSKLDAFLTVSADSAAVVSGYEDYPVHSIAWFGIPYICNILSEMNNYEPCYETKTWNIIEGADGYRLPTFEEWEFLARGGRESEGYTYSGSNDPEEAGWYRSNSDGTAHETGLKKPNEMGLCDMSGNVCEFTTEIAKPVMISPEVTLLTANRIWRGGSYRSAPAMNVEFIQNINFPDYFLPFSDVGFRTVRNVK